MQARYYDPVIGRFLSVDPVTFMDTGNSGYFNRFAYSGNDPVNFSDPTGKYRCKKSACPQVDQYVSRLKESRNSSLISAAEKASIDRSISAIGEKGEKGSVKIKLDENLKTPGEFRSKSLFKSAAIVINPKSHDGDIDDLASVLGHEGSHLATENETGVKSTHENAEERFNNEVTAYETNIAVDKGLGITDGWQDPVAGAKASMKGFCRGRTEGACGPWVSISLKKNE